MLKFNLGDRVKVISQYMSEPISSDIGTVVLIRQNGSSHPYGIEFDNYAPHRHDLYTGRGRIETGTWPVLKDRFEMDEDEEGYSLKSRQGYYIPEKHLALAVLQYDPLQQGDTDEDI